MLRGFQPYIYQTAFKLSQLRSPGAASRILLERPDIYLVTIFSNVFPLNLYSWIITISVLRQSELRNPLSLAMLSRSFNPLMLWVMMFYITNNNFKGVVAKFYLLSLSELDSPFQSHPCRGIRTCFPSAIKLDALLRIGVFASEATCSFPLISSFVVSVDMLGLSRPILAMMSLYILPFLICERGWVFQITSGGLFLIICDASSSMYELLMRSMSLLGYEPVHLPRFGEMVWM